MSIPVGDNFSYQGKKYLDNRQSFKTKEEMMAYNDVPEGFITYCDEDGQQYQYKNSKWDVYTVSGSGSVDVDLSNYATKDDLKTKFDDVAVNEEETTDDQTAIDFFANGEKKKTIYFSGGGGASGSPYISTMLSENILVETDTDFELVIDFASPNAGKGTLKVFVNDIDSLTASVQQGESRTIVSHDLLTKGTNKVVVYVIDRLGTMSNSLTFYIRYGGTEVTGDFDSSIAYDRGTTIRYYFIPTALDTSLGLTFYMSIDGAVQTGVVCYSDVRGYFTFPGSLDVGAHYCEAWVEDSNGGKSNVLIFNLIIIDDTSLVVSSETKTVTLEEGAQLSLDYRVYKKNDTSFITKTYIDDNLVSTGTCTLAPSYYKSSTLPEGMHTIKIEVWNLDETVSDYVTWTVIVTPSTYTMLEPVNAGAIFIASAQNRTNSDENRDKWIGHDQDGTPIEATLVNFAFNSESGWVDDTILITGRSHIEVPVKPLLNNARYGLTLDIEFMTKPIGVENAEVLNIWDDVNNCGIKITTEELIMQSKSGSKCDLYFTEEQVVSAIFVIDRNEKAAKIYLNGVMCEAFALSDYVIDGQSYLEDFTVDKNIILGGEDRNGYSAIKNLRVYDIALGTDEILNNFMCNEIDKGKQRALVEFQKGDQLPTITVYCDFSGLGKNDKKNCDIFYNSPDVVKYGESFALQGKKCQLQYQGTSSMAYPIKNYRLNLRDENGDKWYYPFAESQPECRFTLKADFMSSGHWTNTGLTKWINKNLYNYDFTDPKTMNPAKWWAIQNGLEHTEYRECINGFPCRLILVNDGTSPLNTGQYEPTPGNTKDMGVFNFNLDKDCENTLGFTIPDFPESISMEVTANSDTSAGAFISYRNSGVTDMSEMDYIKQSFELRYGDGDEDTFGFLDINGDTTKGLKRLIDWVDNCTDEEFVRDFEQYFNKDYTLRYYLLVITLGMVDNLGKNMMLDSYDGKVWMPRFYDCDTICSYDNSGQLKFDVDIEMSQGYWNTSSSRLWTRLRDLFHDELVEKYNNMRQNGMSYESFMECFYDEQIAKIPQKYYNMDFDVKYGPFIDQYAGVAHGDTYEHLKRWLKNRLIFTDSLYDYAPSYTNDMLTIRANTTELMSLTIETYTPVYQHVSFFNGHMAKEKIAKGQTFTFSGYAQAATDQEVLIYGGSNVKRITGISSMNPNSMLIGGATRLVELDISDCPILVDVNANKANFSPHTYLNKLDISNCPKLGGILRVNNSPLLQELDARNTAVTSLMLPASVRNLETLRLPNGITDLTLTDGNMLRTIDLADGTVLQRVSMVNCNDITEVRNFDLTTVTELTLNNSYSMAEELLMRDATVLNLSNMNKLKRLIFLPNTEREEFNHALLRNDPTCTVTTFNCPLFKTFMTTAPQRISYNGEDTEVKPNSVFSVSTLDISNTQIDTVKFLCTTDINMLKLPTTIKNFYCDSTFDIDTNVIKDANYDFIHGDLIDQYCTHYVDNVGNYDIVPSAADGSLIFGMYAPAVGPVEPASGIWDLYGLTFNDFFTFGMNNNVIQSDSGITMPNRYSAYDITIENANIKPANYHTMMYPLLVNEERPIMGTLDYTNYKGTTLDYAFAYTDISDVRVTLPIEVTEQINSMYRIVYKSNFTFEHPYVVANYITNARGIYPTFNSGYSGYVIIEEDNDDGTYEVTIGASSATNTPTQITFYGDKSPGLVEVKYIHPSVTNGINMFAGCTNLVRANLTGNHFTIAQAMFQNTPKLKEIIGADEWDMSSVPNTNYMFAGSGIEDYSFLTNWNLANVTEATYMFRDTIATEMDISGWNSPKILNMTGFLYNANKLQKLTVGKLVTRSTTNITSALRDTLSLTEVIGTSNWDTTYVVNMQMLFYNTPKLKTIDMTGWNFAGLNATGHQNIFNGAGVETIIMNDISWSDPAKVNAILRGATKLTTVVMDEIHPDMVNFDGIFANCAKLQNDIQLPERTVSAIGAFQNCVGMTHAHSNWETYYPASESEIPETGWWTTGIYISNSTGEEIANSGFWCTPFIELNSAITLTTEYTGHPNIRVSGYDADKNFIAAYDVPNEWWVPTSGASYNILKDALHITPRSDIKYIRFSAGNAYCSTCTITMGIPSVDCYAGCVNIKSIDDEEVNSGLDLIPMGWGGYEFLDGITAELIIDTTGFANTTLDIFQRANVSMVDWGDGTVESYITTVPPTSHTYTSEGIFTIKARRFQEDQSLLECGSNNSSPKQGLRDTLIEVVRIDASTSQAKSRTFWNCTKLKKASIDYQNVNATLLGASVFQYFYGCTSLEEVKLRNFPNIGSGGLQAFFQGCSSLTTIDTDDVFARPVGTTMNLQNTFTGCSSLVDFSFLKKWSLGLVNNMMGTFSKVGAEYIDLSNTNMPVTMFSDAFNGCPNLVDVNVDGWLKPIDPMPVVNTYYSGNIMTKCPKLTRDLYIHIGSMRKLSSYVNTGCTSLPEITDLSEMDTSQISSIALDVSKTGLIGVHSEVGFGLSMSSMTKFTTLRNCHMVMSQYGYFYYGGGGSVLDWTFETYPGSTNYMYESWPNNTSTVGELNYNMKFTDTRWTVGALVSFLECLYDYAAEGRVSEKVIKFGANLDKLTDEQIAIATNKGWTLS